MADSSETFWVLCPSPTQSSGGALADSAPYTLREIRAAIRLWYQLPNNTSIKLDIKRVYPWLGREWQDLFQLYARGYHYHNIHLYHVKLLGLPTPEGWAGRRQDGFDLVLSLVKRISWLMGLSLVEMPRSSKTRKEKA